MKPNLQPALVNDPLGDPGLMIRFRYEKRVLLFDLGDLSAVSHADLLKVSHVFVSHTHIDHFIGFDRLLRMVFGRGKVLTLYGPKNFIANVAGKLAGFTWNLVDRYNESITLQVKEVHEDHMQCATFRAADRFQRSDEKVEPLQDSVILDEPAFAMHCAILEHRTPCLGFALKEKFHVNIKKDQLVRLNFRPGPWLNELKRGVFEGAPESQMIPVLLAGSGKTEDRSLGYLKKALVEITPGQKIAYVVDTVFNEENNARIVGLVKDADVFFCESPFVAEEEERARDRCHLTARQAGLLARQAGVKQLRVFHFSARHTHQTALLYQQAEEAFHPPGEASVPLDSNG